jgi:hypothetical protein
MKLTGAGTISTQALDALSNDTNLLICTACGTQYPGPVKTCSYPAHGLTDLAEEVGPICEDPRQFVPESGQTFTSLAQLGDRVHHVTPDKEDGRIAFISTEPGFGINQTRTPPVRESADGSYTNRDV